MIYYFSLFDVFMIFLIHGFQGGRAGGSAFRARNVGGTQWMTSGEL